MPHLHGVFWLEEEVVKKYKDDKGEFVDDKIPELIDEWISCSIDTGSKDLDQLVKELNIHKHTKSCQKGKNISCRFSFPRLPSNRTLIAKPLSEEELGKEEYERILKDSKNTLDRVKAEISKMEDEELEKSTLEDVLEKISISSDTYHSALSVSQRGKTVILKRKLNEMWVNNYNPLFMRAWKANMDIQFCMDSYAIVTYISDYLTKGDAGLTKELKNALKETKHCNNFEQLNYLKMVYFKHKQVSVSEATYRLVKGLDLKKSNIACTFLATGFPRNRSTFFRQAFPSENSVEEEDPSSEEKTSANEDNATETVTLEGRQGKYKEVETIHQKYSQRPESLNNVCLAQFASSYIYIKADKIPKETEWKDDGASIQLGNLEEFR